MVTKSRIYAKDVVSGEVVRVTGWQMVETGIAGSDKYPLSSERWCRVRCITPPCVGGLMLCHPSRLMGVAS